MGPSKPTIPKEERILCDTCYKTPFCDMYKDCMDWDEGRDGLPTQDIGCSHYHPSNLKSS